MARDFLGSGWADPVQTDDQGNIALIDGEANIERSVRIVLGTAPGERMMRPDFGCDIHDLVFSTLSPTTLNRMEECVRRALIQWEPRIAVESVDAAPDPGTPNKVLIDIEYWIESTNSRSNLVYPFYLQETNR